MTEKWIIVPYDKWQERQNDTSVASVMISPNAKKETTEKSVEETIIFSHQNPQTHIGIEMASLEMTYFNPLHPIHYKFKRNKVIVSGIGCQWDIDLIDMIKYR